MGLEILKPYQRDRLIGFVDPTSDPAGSTYNITQSITAVGAGGVDGRGVQGATQTSLNYLPEHDTDFVFASLAEQRGFVGAAILLLLYLLVVWRGLRIMASARDAFCAIAAGGIVFMFIFQIFVNVGMTIGIAPITGIPLPFLSVGGSSMVTNLLAMGILQAIHIRSVRPRRPRRVRRRSETPDVLSSRSSASSGRGSGDPRPIVVGGVPALVPALARELRRDGLASAVVEHGSPENAAALVYVLEGEPSAGDLAVLRAASAADRPIVAVTEADAASLPYVLATDIVRVLPGAGFPVDEIGDAIARRLGEGATSLAARLPALRRPVSNHLIRHFSRVNGVIAAAVFVPGVDMPVLTLNQMRLVLRLALAHGEEVDANRALELATVVGGAFGLRALARELLHVVPFGGWALKGGVAYGGTRAVGEAALRYFEAGAPLADLVPSRG